MSWYCGFRTRHMVSCNWVNIGSCNNLVMLWIGTRINVDFSSAMSGAINLMSIPHMLQLSITKIIPKLQIWNCILQWRHNECDGVSNHQSHDCLLNRLFRRRSKKTLKLRFTGLCAWNSPMTGEFPAQMASNVDNVSIWWRHHESCIPEVNELTRP